jgi:dynein heavy chain 1
MPSAASSACVVVVKAREGPLDVTRPLPPQVQVVAVTVDRASEDDEDINQALFARLHQLTRHYYAPLVRCARQGGMGQGQSGQGQVLLLQKRVRELDLALEQCQRGTTIPSITLPAPPTVIVAAQQTNSADLRNFLEKYNPSLVDQLFRDVSLSLGDSEEAREEFATQVNTAAKHWPQEISRQTRLLESPFAGSVEKEINFWRDLDRKLGETKEMLESAPILLTKLVLKRTNRVSEQLIAEAESTLDRSMKMASVSLSFLRDFPIEELLSASSLPPLSRAMVNCLLHFSKLKHSLYDFSRAVRLLEVLGHVVLARVVGILRERNVMQCGVDELRNIRAQSDLLFSDWKSNLTSQRTVLKDVAKRRNEKNATFRFEFDSLQARLRVILEFREQHERLVVTLSDVLAGTEGDCISHLAEGFTLVLRANADLLDLTGAGAAAWLASMQLYEKKLERVEEHITRILEERLGKARSADEMFRLFRYTHTQI